MLCGPVAGLDSMWDPVGRLIIELREAPDVAAIAGENPHAARDEDVRVRGQEPGPGDAQAHDAVPSLRADPHPGPAAAWPACPPSERGTSCSASGAIGSRPTACTGPAAMPSTTLGPAWPAAGMAIYVSHDDTGGSPLSDPDTEQPYYEFVVESIATTQVVA